MQLLLFFLCEGEPVRMVGHTLYLVAGHGIVFFTRLLIK